MYIVLSLTAHREGRKWVSSCPELGTASCGDTKQEALENIQEATLLYLNTLEELGECQKVLHERGIAVHRGEATSIGNPAPQPHRRSAEVVYPAMITLPVACSA